MARKIILLDRASETGDYRVVFWLDVQAARQRFYANAVASSAFLDATTEEITALQSGAVVEVVERVNSPNGRGLPALRVALQAMHDAMQAELDANNVWHRYGSSFDGTTWTAVAVA
jgi:hypothetical protein